MASCCCPAPAALSPKRDIDADVDVTDDHERVMAKEQQQATRVTSVAMKQEADEHDREAAGQQLLPVRKACNLCRSRKVRCDRTPLDAGGCARCRREGVECCYGAWSSLPSLLCSADQMACAWLLLQRRGTPSAGHARESRRERPMSNPMHSAMAMRRCPHRRSQARQPSA